MWPSCGWKQILSVVFLSIFATITLIRGEFLGGGVNLEGTLDLDQESSLVVKRSEQVGVAEAKPPVVVRSDEGKPPVVVKREARSVPQSQQFPNKPRRARRSKLTEGISTGFGKLL